MKKAVNNFANLSYSTAPFYIVKLFLNLIKIKEEKVEVLQEN